MREIALTIALLFLAMSASATWHSDVVSGSNVGEYSSASMGVPSNSASNSASNSDSDVQFDAHGHCGHMLSHFTALPLNAGVSATDGGISWPIPSYIPPHHLPLESHYQPPRHRLS